MGTDHTHEIPPPHTHTQRCHYTDISVECCCVIMFGSRTQSISSSGLSWDPPFSLWIYPLSPCSTALPTLHHPLPPLTPSLTGIFTLSLPLYPSSHRPLTPPWPSNLSLIPSFLSSDPLCLFCLCQPFSCPLCPLCPYLSSSLSVLLYTVLRGYKGPRGPSFTPAIYLLCDLCCQVGTNDL